MLPLPDVLGMAIYRLDEVVTTDPDVISALRPVLRYRTTLARGEPDESFRAHWDAARLLFPRWVGFHPGRRRWSRWSEAAYLHIELETDRIIRSADAHERAERIAEMRAREQADRQLAGLRPHDPA